MNHWDSPLGLATRHDKARAKADRLRKQVEDLDAKADELARRYEEAMASGETVEMYLARKRRELQVR